MSINYPHRRHCGRGEAIQHDVSVASALRLTLHMDCFVAFSPCNDGSGEIGARYGAIDFRESALHSELRGCKGTARRAPTLC
ncbi:MAG: hypothetical protein LBI59_11200, partial [Candidatus Accumulibacter sp.]|nr:hypothetical protein [Accumulibacter sp.]